MDKISHIVSHGQRMSTIESRAGTRPAATRIALSAPTTSQRAASLHAEVIDHRRSAGDRFFDTFNDVFAPAPVAEGEVTSAPEVNANGFPESASFAAADINRAAAVPATEGRIETEPSGLPGNGFAPPSEYRPRGSFIDIQA